MPKVDHNKEGPLLEEILQDGDGLYTVLPSGLKDIDRILIEDIYQGDRSALSNLKDELANYESMDREELNVKSRGIADKLRTILEEHDQYDPDTINQIFIGLNGFLGEHLNHIQFESLTDYSRPNNLDESVDQLITLVNFYHVLSDWITENRRLIEGYKPHQLGAATKQFRKFKEESADKIHRLREIANHSYNLELSYERFRRNMNWESYQNELTEIINPTREDAKRLGSHGDKNIHRFASVLMLNSQYFLLRMSYDMLHDEGAKKTIPDIKKFKESLRRRIKSKEITYLDIQHKSEEIYAIDRTEKKLPVEVWEFYDSLMDVSNQE